MEETAAPAGHRSGYVALVGRPNAGKSTLLNRLVGQKIAIVSDKPQTTRTRILGIRTTPEAQFLFIDTPGIHDAQDVLNKRMVAVADQALLETDVVLWIVDATRGEKGIDAEILARVSAPGVNCCVALNKVDALDKRSLLPLLARLSEALPGRELVPISALDGDNVDRLLEVLRGLLPEGPRFYPEDEITDQTERVLAQEIVREQVLAQTRHEVPYATAVVVDSFEERPEKQNLVVIQATINVARPSQKAIVIGKGGSRLKSIGKAAREQLEALLGKRVFLELFVRVQEDWNTDLRRIKEFDL